MLPHYLTNFKIQKYYQNEPKLNDIYSKNNVPKKKDETYVINLDEYNNVTYFDSFGVENVPKEIKTLIGNKNVITNIYRIEAHNSIM